MEIKLIKPTLEYANDIMEYKLKFDTSNGVTKADFLVNNDEIYYTGTIESNLNLAFISLKNY